MKCVQGRSRTDRSVRGRHAGDGAPGHMGYSAARSDRRAATPWPGGGYPGSASTWPAIARRSWRSRWSFAATAAADRQLPLPVKRAALVEPLAVSCTAWPSVAASGTSACWFRAGPIGLHRCCGGAGGAAEVVCADLLAGPLQRARALGEASPVPIGTVQIGVEDLPDSHFDPTPGMRCVPQALHGLLLATAGRRPRPGRQSAR